MDAEVDTSVCPVCSQPNRCGISQGKSECWCFELTIDPAALERVPLALKDRACLCPRCAQMMSNAESP